MSYVISHRFYKQSIARGNEVTKLDSMRQHERHSENTEITRNSDRLVRTRAATSGIRPPIGEGGGTFDEYFFRKLVNF